MLYWYPSLRMHMKRSMTGNEMVALGSDFVGQTTLGLSFVGRVLRRPHGGQVL